MKIDETSIAFVTAHFAAGQSAVEDRNRDYATITAGLRFKNDNVSACDHVFWFGDFNYRLEADNGLARRLIGDGNLQDLWGRDQLRNQMEANQVFGGFKEGVLGFAPTYKYDVGTVVYDTSEKQRVPAWTDRVLYRGAGIELLEYGRGEQLMSDHRPVRAVFTVPIMENGGEIKSSGVRGLQDSIGRSAGLERTSSKPPPSTEQIKWWETGQEREIKGIRGSNPFYDFPPDLIQTRGNYVRPYSIQRSKEESLIDASTQPYVNLMD